MALPVPDDSSVPTLLLRLQEFALGILGADLVSGLLLRLKQSSGGVPDLRLIPADRLVSQEAPFGVIDFNGVPVGDASFYDLASPVTDNRFFGRAKKGIEDRGYDGYYEKFPVIFP